MSRSHFRWTVTVTSLVLMSLLALEMHAEESSSDRSLWRVEFTVDAAENVQLIEGRILVEAQDGGILLEDRAGVLWNLTPDRLIRREQTDEDYSRMPAQELADQLRLQIGGTAQIVTTDHYLIATTGSRLHAEWCGALLERLLKAFMGYWRSPELNLNLPDSPLPVVIYPDRESFTNAAIAEGGATFSKANGYYSMKSNRVSLFDHTSESNNNSRPLRSRADVQRFMIGNTSYVSTIAHEATHQIAFNSGMHTRYADNPIWLTEGMAMFFELPDLHSRSGWRTMGRVNPSRLLRFRDSLTTERMHDSLSTLTADDTRFHNPETIEAAYAEAWLFTHFLIHSHRREYMAYLKICSEHTPLNWKTREERLREFEEAFGHSPMNFESQLRQYAATLGPR